MIDLNTLFSNALTAAITNAVAPLNARIAALESANDILHRVQHEDMVAMRDRIAALEEKVHFLESQAIVTSNAVDTRITALENNPAQGVDTQPAPATTTHITQHIIDALGDIEHPLFKRLSSFMDAVAEQAMDNHCETYDHDSYDSAVSDLEDRDFVTNDNLEDAVRDAVRNLSFDVSVS